MYGTNLNITYKNLGGIISTINNAAEPEPEPEPGMA